MNSSYDYEKIELKTPPQSNSDVSDDAGSGSENSMLGNNSGSEIEMLTYD